MKAIHMDGKYSLNTLAFDEGVTNVQELNKGVQIVQRWVMSFVA